MCKTYKDRNKSIKRSKPHRENVRPYVRPQKQYETYNEEDDYVPDKHLQ